MTRAGLGMNNRKVRFSKQITRRGKDEMLLKLNHDETMTQTERSSMVWRTSRGPVWWKIWRWERVFTWNTDLCWDQESRGRVLVRVIKIRSFWMNWYGVPESKSNKQEERITHSDSGCVAYWLSGGTRVFDRVVTHRVSFPNHVHIHLLGWSVYHTFVTDDWHRSWVRGRMGLFVF